MGNLKNKLIKLGSENPDLQEHVSVVLSRLEKKSSFTSETDLSIPPLEDNILYVEDEAEFELKDSSFIFDPTNESRLRLVFDSTTRSEHAFNAEDDPEEVLHRYLSSLRASEDRLEIEKQGKDLVANIYWRG